MISAGSGKQEQIVFKLIFRIMFKVYIKAAWRSLVKNRLVSSINIFGLSISIAASLLIFEYVNFEFSYDHFNNNAANIYRVYNDRYQHGKRIQHGTETYSAISKALKADFPEIVDYTRVEPQGENIVFFNGEKLPGQQVLSVENSFLSIFSYTLLAGNFKSALEEPHTTVITRSLAKKIFGSSDENLASVLGKTIGIGTQSYLFKITGVCEDVPENSHLHFDCLTSYITLYNGKDPWKEADYDFKTSQFWHYVVLKPGIDYKIFQEKLSAFSVRHFHVSAVTGSVEKFYLQPLLSAHMYSDFEYEIGDTANATVIWGLFITSILILIIAWINYVNLTIAKSFERGKEVGIRKIAGASKHQLIYQFMFESILINIFSIFFALTYVFLFQKYFNTLIGHQLLLTSLVQNSLGGYKFPAILVLFIFSGILISGFYPSFVLSSFKPILVLKGRAISNISGIVLKKILVIGQFAVTIFLVIGSVVVFMQMRLISKNDLGFNISKILIIKGPELAKWDSTLLPKQTSFINEIKLIPGISEAAFSSNLPGDELGRSFDIHRTDQSSAAHYTIRVNWVSPWFIRLLQIKLVAGRQLDNNDFQSNGLVGRHNLILNVTAAKMLGFKTPAESVGRRIIWNGSEYEVVGVVSDFRQRSLHYPIEPTMFMTGTSPQMPFSIKLVSNHLDSTIAAIKKKFDAVFPGNIFNYYFLDEKFNSQYSSDQLFGKVFGIFSGIAIFVACLGVLGLSFFTALRRTKEIGIRKVLGASVASIVIMLSEEFIILVLIAILIASPIAWFLMHNWLQSFDIRINMSWWIYIGSGLLAIAIAALTISFQSIKAASADPAKSLRSD